MTRRVVPVDALVIGAGPAGLAAATALKTGGAGRVMVLERENEAGGTPRFCAHTGFGLRDLHRVLSGPAYARRWVERASTNGVDIRTHSMVTAWAGPGQAEVTGPDGLLQVHTRAVVLATGARERPRAARLVPGSRPSGIFTTGQLQQWVHRQHLPLSGRALIVGAEHVSYSAVLTLREAGVRTVALATHLPHPQTFRSFDLATRIGFRVPVWTRTSVTAVTGRDRVDGVLICGPDGAKRAVAVDVVVFTGDFIPDNELARMAHLLMDPGTKGPACEMDGTTSAPGVFAAGNLVHPAETADVAAQRATAVGAAAAAWLRGGQDARAGDRTDPARVRLGVADPLLWVVPNLAHPGSPATEPLLVRTRVFLDRPRLIVTQGGRLLGSFRPRRLIPNRSHAVPAHFLRLIQPGEEVLLSVS